MATIAGGRSLNRGTPLALLRGHWPRRCDLDLVLGVQPRTLW